MLVTLWPDGLLRLSEQMTASRHQCVATLCFWRNMQPAAVAVGLLCVLYLHVCLL